MEIFFSLMSFASCDKIPKIKTFHMVASEHPEVIEERRLLISTDFPESEKAAEDGSIDNGGSSLDEEDDNISGEAVVRKGVT